MSLSVRCICKNVALICATSLNALIYMYIIYVKNITIKIFLSMISIHFCIYFKEYYQVKSNAILLQHFGFNCLISIVII